MKKIVLFASGSGSNVENIVNFYKENEKVEILRVFTNNPKAYVIERCAKLNIECTVFGRKEFRDNLVILDELRSINPDLIVLAGFLWLIPSDYIQSFPQKIVNIHPAMLPKYGGKGMFGQHVHEAVVQNGEKETGITIHYVNERYDEGQIIKQISCELKSTDTAEDVASKIHELEYTHFPLAIDELLNKD